MDNLMKEKRKFNDIQSFFEQSWKQQWHSGTLSVSSFINVKMWNEKQIVAQADRSLQFVELLAKQEPKTYK